MHRHDTPTYPQLVNRDTDTDTDTDTGTWIMGTVHGRVLVQRQLVNRDRNTGTETRRDANVNFGASYPQYLYGLTILIFGLDIFQIIIRPRVVGEQGDGLYGRESG